MYRKQGGQWVRVGGNLEGHGLAAIYSGDSTPDPAVGQNGDLWIPDTPVPFGGGLTDVPMAFTGNNPIAGVPYGVVIEGAGTNHITNPRLAVDLIGWPHSTYNTPPTLSRIVGDAPIGDAYMRAVYGTTVTADGVRSVRAVAAPGQVWSGSVWVRAESGTVTGRVAVEAHVGVNPADAGVSAAITEFTASTTWQRVVVVHTMPATTGGVSLNFDDGGVASQIIHFGGFQLEQAAQPSTYIDGSLGPGYAWTGAAHASTSTRTVGTKVLSNKPRLDVAELWASGVVATSSSATAKPLVIKGAASQSANLQEWQDSAGALRVIVRAGGQMAITPDANANSTGLFVSGGAPSAVKMEVRGAASQTASLVEFQNSAGNVLSWIGAGGGFVIGGAGVTGAYASPNAYLNVQTRAPGNPGLAVRGAAAQTANLVEFQRDDGLNIFVVDMESTVTAMLSSLIINLGNIGLRRIEVGALDSAGAGYRTVRVAN